MNDQKYTIQAQELLQSAVQAAQSRSNQMIETGHLLKAILVDKEGIGTFLLQKTGINIETLEKELQVILGKYPKQEGVTDTFLSRDAQRALYEARETANKMGDQFITTEHILAGLLAVKMMYQGCSVLGLKEQVLEKAIQGVRGGRKADSQTTEQTFDALNKYAVNLNEMSAKGKIDPVIGRDDEIRRVLQILSRRTKTIPYWWENRCR